MKEIKYQWQRYWVPPNAKISLTDQGFIEDPTSGVGKYVSADLVTLEELNKLGCLILLGEPGIGKSTEIEKLFQTVRNDVGEDYVLLIDLRNVMTPDYFIQRLTRDVKFKRWEEESKPLYLFLDSFDEGTFTFSRFANYFSEFLIQHSERLNNLHLRISCRTALWLAYLGDSLDALWGKENCQRYELCPLTKRDVETALNVQGISKQKFLHEVQNKGVAGLAGKPLTLNFLMDVFTESGGQLLGRKSEIYSRGCELLAQEPDTSRRVNPSEKPKLNMPQKTAVAERIAVATLIGGKSAVVIENEYGLSDWEISITQLHGREIVEDVPVTLGDAEIKEVLNTGLFSSRGEGKVGWAHQTYGEYLAARYIVRHHLPWRQVHNLLFQDPLEIGVFQAIPQLYEVSAWLASLDTSFF